MDLLHPFEEVSEDLVPTPTTVAGYVQLMQLH